VFSSQEVSVVGARDYILVLTVCESSLAGTFYRDQQRRWPLYKLPGSKTSWVLVHNDRTSTLRETRHDEYLARPPVEKAIVVLQKGDH
jgi:hypothetical protein